MISANNLNRALRLLLLVLLVLLIALAIFVVSTNGQTGPPAQQIAAPIFDNYRGAQIGMNVTDVRQKLGAPSETAAQQDLYFFSENESAQIYYDAAHKVKAISISYTGDGAPAVQRVLGTDVAAGPDGSLFKLVSYPQAGFWVAYSRSAGPAPVVTITLQRIVQ
jgi:hypothetical protein